MIPVIFYKRAVKGTPLVCVSPEEVLAPKRTQWQLPLAMASNFIDAAAAGGVSIDEAVLTVLRMRKTRPDLLEQANTLPAGCAVPAWSVDPIVSVYVEPFPGEQPWPVFVAVGGDVVAEFYPVDTTAPEVNHAS